MSATGLVAVFATAVTPFVPTEPVLIGMGALAAARHASPGTVIVVGAVGCCISDHILYLAARLAGHRVPGRIRRWTSGPLAERVARWGPAGLVAGRWLPAGGTVAALVAGACRWRLRRFTPASAIGSTAWSAYATLLGYLGGALTDRPLPGAIGAVLVAGTAAVLARVLARPRGTDRRWTR